MATAVGDPGVYLDEASLADRDVLGHGKAAAVADDRAVADRKRGAVDIPGGEAKPTLAVNKDAVTDNDVTFSLNPMHKNTCSQTVSIASTMSLEQGLAH